jgi:hypothetical protein
LVNCELYRFIHAMLRYIKNNGEGSWVKILKWKFANYFSAYNNQEERAPRPPADLSGIKHRFFHDDNVLLGGICIKYLQRLQVKNPGSHQVFVDSVLLSLKKSMPPVPESLVDKAKDDTFTHLTTEPPPVVPQTVTFEDCEVYQPPLVVDQSLIESQLRRSVSEIFKGECFTEADIYEVFVASGSANYNRTRDESGAIGSLYELGIYGCESELHDFGTELGLFGDPVAPSYGAKGKSEQNIIQAEKILGYDCYESGAVTVLDVTRQKERWVEQYNQLFELALGETPYVEIVGLCEPLKVRNISKGPPITYTVLRPFQAWLWRVLKRHSVFALISRYQTEDDIMNTLGHLADFEEAVSGDYKASTDNLHSWVSETICDQLFIEVGENIPREFLSLLPRNFLVNLKTLFLRALTGHIFVHKGVEAPQREGQLMGSIISFPFLCIANAALCRFSIEYSYGRRFRLTSFGPKGSHPVPLIVNGDDCLFRGPKGTCKKTWLAVCGVAGLESSVGKTYYSSSFCTINSTIYRYDPSLLIWKEQKYINLGLMMGRRRPSPGETPSNNKKKRNPYKKEGSSLKPRKKDRTKKSDPPFEFSRVKLHQLGVICRELKRTCPSEFWPLAKARFIYYNMETLRSVPGLPWFIPEWLGGIGLPLDSEFELDSTDRKCATLIRAAMGGHCPFKEPPRDRAHAQKILRSFTPVKPREMPKWQMHLEVQRRLDSLHVVTPNFRTVTVPSKGTLRLADEYAKAYKYLTSETLQRLPLHRVWDLMNEDGSVEKALRHNVALWASARHCLGNRPYEEIQLDELRFENKNLVPAIYVSSLYDSMDGYIDNDNK